MARESRPEASGTSSRLAQKLQEATATDLKAANKMVKHLRSAASQGLSVSKMNPDQIRLVSVSDSGGVGSAAGRVHNATMVLATP